MNQRNRVADSSDSEPFEPAHIGQSFRGGINPRPNDIFIAVMGVTGSGKSTLISLCTTQRVKIGHSLQACTQEVSVYVCKYSGKRNIFLVDTPGFDDTNRSDTDVLRELARWLTASYTHKIQLHGIIYLHRITDIRMQGSAKRNLLMFQKLCGPGALKNVILATTMWEMVDPECGAAREAELLTTSEFWGWMQEQGSQVVRHTNSREAAMKLLENFTVQGSQKTKVVLDIQAQMVDQSKSLDETAAGIELGRALIKERKRFERQLAQLEEDMKESLELYEGQAAEMLREQQLEMVKHIKKMDYDRAKLEISTEMLHKQELANLENALEQSKRENAKLLKQAQKMR